jgi:hypothetical protein
MPDAVGISSSLGPIELRFVGLPGREVDGTSHAEDDQACRAGPPNVLDDGRLSFQLYTAVVNDANGPM